jgi:hypothetical protein
MVFDAAQHRFVLFGGKTDPPRLADGLWEFDLTKLAWQEIPMEGAKPPGIDNVSAIHDPIANRLIIYGGDRDLWALDLKTQRWRNMSGSEVPRRESHSAIYDERGRRMVVFGGSDRGRWDLSEVWALDLDPGSPTFEKWQNLTVEGGHPPGREDHTATYDSKKNRMVIHAGYSRAQKQILDDTWEYAFSETRNTPGGWKQIDTGKLTPPGRRQAIGVYDAARHWLIVHGGESKDRIARKPVFLSDVWAFDLIADVWLDITPGVPGPAARVAHRAIYDSSTQNVILYGGLTEDAHFIPHDVWELRLQPVK